MGSRAEVTATVAVEQINGDWPEMGKQQKIVVKSHPDLNGWNGYVVLKIPGLKDELAVSADQLIQAAERCHNLK